MIFLRADPRKGEVAERCDDAEWLLAVVRETIFAHEKRTGDPRLSLPGLLKKRFPQASRWPQERDATYYLERHRSTNAWV